MYCATVLIYFCLSFSTLHALLDGLVNPIILDTHYTFTPGEVAKGFVYFREGFDVPFNSTIFLRLAKGVQVNGPIVLNNGTINMRASVHLGPAADIVGEGFFLGANTVRVIISDNLIIRNRLKFLGQC